MPRRRRDPRRSRPRLPFAAESAGLMTHCNTSLAINHHIIQRLGKLDLRGVQRCLTQAPSTNWANSAIARNAEGFSRNTRLFVVEGDKNTVISAETILHRIIKSAQIARDVRGGRIPSSPAAVTNATLLSTDSSGHPLRCIAEKW